jgi:hypothetical protein
MNPISRRGLLAACVTLGLAACAAQPELTRLQDPDVDFQAYRRFALMPTQPDGRSSLIERRLLAAARVQMESRGYVYDEFSPEVLVNLAAAVEERQALRSAPGSGGEAFETDAYRLGRLAIDLVDVAREEVVWHGTAEGRLTPAMLRDTGTAAEKAVAAVFQGFPVKPLGRARR